MNLYALLTLIIAIGCYSISQLLQHGKFKWMSKDPLGFWGEDMDKRKDTSKIPFATSLLVWTTDSYHMFQAIYHIFLSLSLALLTDFLSFGWRWLILWAIIVGAHAIFYKLFSK